MSAIEVHTVDGAKVVYGDAEVTFDAVVLQVTTGSATDTFPLCNVIRFTIAKP